MPVSLTPVEKTLLSARSGSGTFDFIKTTMKLLRDLREMSDNRWLAVDRRTLTRMFRFVYDEAPGECEVKGLDQNAVRECIAELAWRIVAANDRPGSPTRWLS